MSLSDYMAELKDPDHEITSGGLAQLSGLAGAEEKEFQAAWGTIDPERRLDLIGRLVEIADDNAEMEYHAVFCHALSDPESAVRERAIAGLWETDDRRTIPLLVGRLENDPADEVRAAAAQALGHFALLADSGKLVDRDSARVWTALKASVEDDDEPIMVRRRALESIASFRAPQIQGWIQWGFDHPEAALRQSALYAMGRSGDLAWMEIVIGEMESDDPAMRYEAANAAREFGEEDALPALTDLINDIDSQVSLAALHSIAGIGGAKARNLLRGYSASADDPAVQEAAAEALEILDADAADFSMMNLKGEGEPDIDYGGDEDDDDDF
jgi:HEAT repeat protein